MPDGYDEDSTNWPEPTFFEQLAEVNAMLDEINKQD